MKNYDAAVIGGGIIGVSCAIALADAGLRVIVLDRQEPGREASWAAAGMLSPPPHLPGDEALVPLARESLKLYPEYIRQIESASRKKTNFTSNGAIELFFGAAAPEERDRYIEACCGLGVKAEAISATEARRLEPALASTVRAGIFFPEEAAIDPRALMEAALDAAGTMRVEIRANCNVQTLDMKRGRCIGVVLEGERVAADRVVIAAGCFSRQIFAADCEARHRLAPFLPTRPVRGQMIALQPRDTAISRAVRSARGYMLPRSNGWIVAGSTLEEAGFDKRTTKEGLQKIRKAAIELVPGLADSEIVESWCGLRPGTPDGLPILGPVDIEGVILATGHFRNGILLAPVTAQLVTKWITCAEAPAPFSAFSPSRFLPPAIHAHAAN
ncbi:MAG TPA: glycine oxidase ThiO [Candidatus Aquilonibacter sp.]|nr:glycine oxidase ThiO [Candidatus Aquilonibacter sp.]